MRMLGLGLLLATTTVSGQTDYPRLVDIRRCETTIDDFKDWLHARDWARNTHDLDMLLDALREECATLQRQDPETHPSEAPDSPPRQPPEDSSH